MLYVIKTYTIKILNYQVINMTWKKRLAIIILLIILAVIIGVAYISFSTAPEEDLKHGDHKILLLLVDPSEKRPGPGAVDMAFIIDTTDGKLVDTTPIYPGGMYHPTARPSYLKSIGTQVLYLHDTLYEEDVNKGAKLAQEIVEARMGIKTDAVLIINPTAVDALIKSVGPIYVEGKGYVNGNSIEFVRDEQYNGGMSRGNAIESLLKPLINAVRNKSNYDKMKKEAYVQYTQGNLMVVPNDIAYKFMVSDGLSFL